MSSDKNNIQVVPASEAATIVLNLWQNYTKKNQNMVLGVTSDSQLSLFFKSFCTQLGDSYDVTKHDLSLLYTVSVDGFLYSSDESSQRRSRILQGQLWQCLHNISHVFDYHKQGFILDSHLEEPEETIFFEEAIEEIGGFSCIVIPEATVKKLPFQGVLEHFLHNVPVLAVVEK